MPSNCWYPSQTNLCSFSLNFRYDFTQIVDMLKINVDFSFIFDGIEPRITNLNVINSFFTCSCQVIFAVIIDNINKTFNIVRFCDFLLNHLLLLHDDFFFSRFFKEFFIIDLFFIILLNSFTLMNLVPEMNLHKSCVFNHSFLLWTDNYLVSITIWWFIEDISEGAQIYWDVERFVKWKDNF